MNVEQLKAKLEAGEITQEQYDQQVAELNNNKGIDEADSNKGLSLEEVQKMIQSEVDKVRTKYVNEKKELEKKYDDLRQKDMSKEDLLKEKETSLRDYELRLKKKELDFETVRHLEEQGLPTKLLPFLNGDDIEARKEQLASLTGLIDEFVTKKTEEKFKSQGREHQQSQGESTPDLSKMSVYDRVMYQMQNLNN